MIRYSWRFSRSSPFVFAWLPFCGDACGERSGKPANPYRTRPILYDSVHLSTTVAREDGTFGFSHHSFTPDFLEFLRQGAAEFERVRRGSELFCGYAGVDTIYCTVLKDLIFTSFEHAHNADAKSSVPLLAFGKAFSEGDIRKMPVSLHFHHGMADGRDAAEFFTTLQHYLDTQF